MKCNGEITRFQAFFAEERSGTETNSGPGLSPKSLNSCWIAPVPQRRETESRLDGGEGGIIRARDPHPCGAAVACAPTFSRTHGALVEPGRVLLTYPSAGIKKGPERGLFLCMAERVGFEPTWGGNAPNRFRVGAVVTASVPLQEIADHGRIGNNLNDI